MPRRLLTAALLLAAQILTPMAAPAQTASEAAPAATPAPAADKAAAPEPAPAVLTLKERLGAKWKDEQRVNNCNVPEEKRGTKPRPEGCGEGEAE